MPRSNAMLHESKDWSVEVPAGWCLKNVGAASVIQHLDSPGVMVIGSQCKETDFTDEELLTLAGNSHLTPITLSRMQGFFSYSRSKTLTDSTWWLRCGKQMIYIMHRCPAHLHPFLAGTVSSVIATVSPRCQ